MSTPNDGGPAFPQPFQFRPSDGQPMFSHEFCNKAGGMTLRDYFAAKALAGLLADCNNCNSADKNAKAAYEHADAMLAAWNGGTK